jgi:protein-S-isoprenylcysteine O-methyltransferase Ste14
MQRAPAIKRRVDGRSTREPMTAAGTGHTVVDVGSAAAVGEVGEVNMPALKLTVGWAWIAFWIYWLVSASVGKQSVPSGWRTRLTGVSVVGVFLIAGVLRGGSLAVHSVVLETMGMLVFACGIALAVWARLHLGHNWGMPMTQRAEPELVTSGPYSFVRHPIYTGLLTAMLGTALVDNLLGLIVVAVLVAYFYYCGTVEERNLTATFPTAYPEYRSRTKMLIPFLL